MERADLKHLSRRALSTRTRLVAAARPVFEQNGFLDARVSDITMEAGVSHGTFYTYFDSKEDVLVEIALDTMDQLLAIQQDRPPGVGNDPIAGLELALRSWIRFYRAHAWIMELLEQVATFSDRIRALRLEMRRATSEGAARFIRHHQRTGVVDRAVDAHYTGHALGAMNDRFAYTWFVLGEEFDEERAVAALLTIWCRAVGLPAPASVEHPAPIGADR